MPNEEETPIEETQPGAEAPPEEETAPEPEAGGEEAAEATPDSTQDAIRNALGFDDEEGAAEEPPAAPGASAGAETLPDPDDLYKAPEGLSEGANTRFRQLAERAKALEGEAQAARGEYDRIIDMVSSTGATQQEMASTLQYMTLAHSQDPRALEQALTMVEQERSALLQRLGRDAPGFDALADYPDIKAKVDGMEISREDALELAQARRKTDAFERHQAEQAAVQAYGAEERAAVAELNTIGNELAKRDPDYALKIEMVKPVMATIKGSYPPHAWGRALGEAYRQASVSIKQMRAAGVMQQPGKPPGGGRRQAPLGGGAPAGGGTREPKTLEDAIRAGIERAGA